MNDAIPSSVPCALCDAEPGTVEAILNDQTVLVCASCFRYETGEDEDGQ